MPVLVSGDTRYGPDTQFGSSVYNILSTAYGGGPGAVGAGNATADTAALAAATSAMVAAGRGLVYLPGGDYHINSFPSFTPPAAFGPMPYGFQGAGRQATRIYSHATSLANSLTVYNPAFDVTLGAAAGVPEWGGFTIDGANATNDAVGLHWGDVGGVAFRDMELTGFTNADAMLVSANYGWVEKVVMDNVSLGNSANLLRFRVGLGLNIGTVTTTIANAATGQTTVAVSGGVGRALYSGQTFLIYSGTGTAVQILTTSSAVAQGATSIPVVSFTAAATYTSGTAMIYTGGYGSFDYWTVNSLNFDLRGHQNGIVSEIPMGIKGNSVERVGSTWRITGNAQDVSSNTGKFMWLKGNDPWTQIVWDVAVEHDGTGSGHVAVQVDDATNSGIAGAGRFQLYGGFAAAVLQSVSQFRVEGPLVNVNGITQAYPGNFGSVSTRNYGMTWANSGPPTLAAYGRTTAPVSGSGGTSNAYMNTLYADVLVAIPFTNATGSDVQVLVAQNTFTSGLGAGSTGPWIKAGTTDTVYIPHLARKYLRLDFPGLTAGAPSAAYYI